MNSKTTAYTDLYQQYYPKIYTYVFFRVNKDPDVATDLSQQTFTNAWQCFETYEDRGFSYESYLVRIAHNLLVNYYRDAQRLHARVMSYDVESFFEDLNYSKEDTHYIDLCNALLKIKIPRRYMLVLYYFEGYKSPEIAELFNISRNAALLQIHGARQDLKKLIEI
jgi:RNA polymerase sigma factor (sigma-70 family)